MESVWFHEAGESWEWKSDELTGSGVLGLCPSFLMTCLFFFCFFFSFPKILVTFCFFIISCPISPVCPFQDPPPTLYIFSPLEEFYMDPGQRDLYRYRYADSRTSLKTPKSVPGSPTKKHLPPPKQIVPSRESPWSHSSGPLSPFYSLSR